MGRTPKKLKFKRLQPEAVMLSDNRNLLFPGADGSAPGICGYCTRVWMLYQVQECITKSHYD